MPCSADRERPTMGCLPTIRIWMMLHTFAQIKVKSKCIFQHFTFSLPFVTGALLSVYFQPSELELWVNFGIAILCFTVIMNSYGPPPLVHCTVRGRAGAGLAEQTNNFCWNNISFIFVLGNMEPRTCSKVIYDLAEMTPIINFPCISV